MIKRQNGIEYDFFQFEAPYSTPRQVLRKACATACALLNPEIQPDDLL
jgi:hypothetical protein